MSDTFRKMNLSNAIAAESQSTEAETTTTTNDDNETEIPFEANESTEGYALFADSASLVEAISVNIFGNDPVYTLLEWGMDLGDYEEIVEENDLNGQQKLDLLHKLAKSTFGGRQSELNEGYGMGWNTDGEGPPTVYDNDEVNHVPYLDVFSELPAFDHYTLNPEEIEMLEDPDIDGATALDMDDFGFDDSIEGPQLPKLDGEPVPILFENGDEVVKMLKMLDNIDWDEVTYCPKDGELQGTPSLGPSEDSDESDSGKVEEATTEESDEDYAEAEKEEDPEANAAFLAKNPEATNDFTANGVKAAKKHIDSEKTLQVMRRVEADGDTRSTALNAIKSRIKALDGDDEETEEETEIEADDDPVESEDEEMTVEKAAMLYDFSEIERDAVEYRVENGASPEEAAKAVSEL